MTLVHWMACALAVPVLLVLLRYGLGLIQVRALRVMPHASATVAAADVPAGLRGLLDAEMAGLCALGFGAFSYRRMPTLLVTRRPLDSWFAVAAHEASGALVAVMPSEEPEVEWLCDIAFTTYFEDGRRLLTTDARAHQLAPFRDALALADGYTGVAADAWALHCNRVAALANAVPVRDTTVLDAREQSLMNTMFDDAIARGRLQRDASGACRLTWRGALDFLQQLAAGQRRRALALAQRRANGSVSAADGAQALAVADARAMAPGLSAVQPRGAASWLRWALLLLMTGVTWATFAWTTGAQFAALLMVTLAVHEAGHYLAMRRFDYANLKVFFVPFLGAAVSGHRADARAWQRVVIYLAGPVPGLLLGAALLALLGHQTLALSTPLWMLSLLLVTVNYVNLLPLEPLDGGRVVALLLFARHPRARTLVFGVGVAGLGALAFGASSPALAIFAALVACGLPGIHRQARLLAELRAQPLPTDEGATLDVLCALVAMKQPQLAFPQRYATVKSLLPELRLPLPTRRETVLGGLCYVIVLCAPLLLAAVLLGDSALRMLPGVSSVQDYLAEQRYAREIAAASTPRERGLANLDAGRHFLLERVDPSRARVYLRAADALAGQLEAHDPRRVDATLLLTETVDDTEARRVLQLALAQADPAQPIPERTRLLEALARRDPARRAQWLAEAVTLRKDAGADDLLELRERLAAARFADGDAAGAARELRVNLDQSGPTSAAASDPQVRAARRQQSGLALAWLLMESGHADEALALITTLDERGTTPVWARHELAIARAWALLKTARGDDAMAVLTSTLRSLQQDQGADPSQVFFVTIDLALFCQQHARERCVSREIARLRRLLDAPQSAWLRSFVPERLRNAESAPFERARRQREAAFLDAVDAPLPLNEAPSP